MAYFEVERGETIEGVDPRLLSILRQAATAYPGSKVVVTDALAGRQSTPNHPRGRAVDIQLYDAAGRPLDNLNNASTFPEYERFALQARAIQQALFPELGGQFAWGGYFRQGTPFDQMHFDIGGSRGAYGNWETGLNAGGQAALGGQGLMGPTRAAAAGLDPNNPLNAGLPGGGPGGFPGLPMPAAATPQPAPPNPISAALSAVSGATGGGEPAPLSPRGGPFGASGEADAAVGRAAGLSKDFLSPLPGEISTSPGAPGAPGAPGPLEGLGQGMAPVAVFGKPTPGPFAGLQGRGKGLPAPTAPLGGGIRYRA